jgi:site-specific DNA-cytosine methylase
MKILVACEESQAVTIELRKLGHEAFSCDILPCSGGYPEWHFKQDVFEVIELGWDMMIGFPPCTHLAVSGAKHFEAKRADGRQQEGINFFLSLAKANIPKIALENPVGIMSSYYRKPDQIIQPWHFGDKFQKTTCLWLKSLPKLRYTEIVEKGEFITTPSGKRIPKWYSDNKSAKARSKTFPGIAKAMAEQWTQTILHPLIVPVQLELFAA